MFKPSLKRLSPTSPSNLSSPLPPPPQLTRTPEHLPPQLIEPMVTPTLLSNSALPNKQTHFNPLNYQWIAYPQTALELIDRQLRDPIARDIGSYQGIFWFFNGQEIVVWREASQLVKRFQLPQKTDIVVFGELESSSLHFKSKNTVIMAAASQNYVHLFGMNRETLDCQDFKFCYQIANSGYIQRIRFTKKDEIAVVSNTGQHYIFDFKSELQVYKPTQHFLRRTLPSLQFLFPQKQAFYQEVLVSGNYICSLVREERKVNWFSVKARQLLSSLAGNNNSEEWIVEDRFIEVYSISRQKRTITLVSKFSQSDILSKIQTNMSKSPNQSAPFLVAINQPSSRPHLIEIVLSSGVFVEIEIQNNFCLSKQTLTIPSLSLIGTVGFFLDKKFVAAVEEDQGKGVSVLASLGSNNLTLLQDYLCFRSQNSIQIVRSGGIRGKLLEMNTEQLHEKKWLFLTEKGYFRIQRLSPSDVLVGLLSERDKLQKLNASRKWIESNNFQLFMDSLGASIGSEKIVEALILLFVNDKSKFELHPQLLNFLSEDLQGHPSPNIRDWAYELVREQISQPIKVSEQMKREMMTWVVQWSNKIGKNQPLEFLGSKRVASAYWLALKSVFVRLTSRILDINPGNVKPLRRRIKRVQLLLQRLRQFIGLKADKEMLTENQLSVKRNQRRQPQQDFFSYFTRKRLDKTNNKLEESTETQPETQPDPRFITESSTALQRDIINATDKINAMIAVFVVLADFGDSQELGTLREALRSIPLQDLLKHKLLQRCVDQEKLWQLNAKLMELSLQKDLKLLTWLQNSKRYSRVDMFDLQELACWVSSFYFGKVLAVFASRLDLQTELLLLFWKRKALDISFGSEILELEAKESPMQRTDASNYRKEFIGNCRREQEHAVAELKAILAKAVCTYIQSEEHTYVDAEHALNRIIHLIALRGEEQLCNFLHSQLTKIKASQKINLFKNLRAKTNLPNPVAERSVPNQVSRKKTPTLFASSFQRQTVYSSL